MLQFISTIHTAQHHFQLYKQFHYLFSCTLLAFFAKATFVGDLCSFATTRLVFVTCFVVCLSFFPTSFCCSSILTWNSYLSCFHIFLFFLSSMRSAFVLKTENQNVLLKQLLGFKSLGLQPSVDTAFPCQLIMDIKKNISNISTHYTFFFFY